MQQPREIVLLVEAAGLFRGGSARLCRPSLHSVQAAGERATPTLHCARCRACPAPRKLEPLPDRCNPARVAHPPTPTTNTHTHPNPPTPLHHNHILVPTPNLHLSCRYNPMIDWLSQASNLEGALEGAGMPTDTRVNYIQVGGEGGELG